MSDRKAAVGTIVVGVDGSASSLRALQWSLAQAERTGSNVVAVLAWRAPSGYGTGSLVPRGAQWAADAKAALESSAAPACEARPRVPVELRAVEGHPAAVLLHEAEHADLLVVGSRGRGAFAGALLGSVSLHCIRYANCPVVVVNDNA
ncbi:universal stress protein [Glycomyces sp. NPDC049804]|uniref:universal stress protein n=1 Tax=Glycomyces sp. NPDC049804 TaxID=3154363 RepID=UPI00342221D5